MNRTRAGGPVDGKARQCGSGVVLMWAAASERKEGGAPCGGVGEAGLERAMPTGSRWCYSASAPPS